MGSSHKHTNPTHAQPCLLLTSSARVVYLFQMRNLHQHIMITQRPLFMLASLLVPYTPQCQSLSRVQLFVTPWTVARQAPLFMGFFSKNTRVGSHSLLQGIFLTQGSNLSLVRCRQILYHLSHQGSYIQGSYTRETTIGKYVLWVLTNA